MHKTVVGLARAAGEIAERIAAEPQKRRREQHESPAMADSASLNAPFQRRRRDTKRGIGFVISVWPPSSMPARIGRPLSRTQMAVQMQESMKRCGWPRKCSARAEHMLEAAGHKQHDRQRSLGADVYIVKHKKVSWQVARSAIAVR
jgi:hypothetical protein